MSKAVLVIDTPEYCIDCPAHFCDDPHYWCGVTNDSLLTDDIETFKPDWCPLKEMPEKLEHDPEESVCVTRYKTGWNRCINTILGNSL